MMGGSPHGWAEWREAGDREGATGGRTTWSRRKRNFFTRKETDSNWKRDDEPKDSGDDGGAHTSEWQSGGDAEQDEPEAEDQSGRLDGGDLGLLPLRH